MGLRMNTNGARAALLLGIEIALFAVALGLQIPPVVSMADEPPDVTFPKVLSFFLFALSRTVSVVRSRSNLARCLAEVVLFGLFTAVACMRADIG